MTQPEIEETQEVEETTAFIDEEDREIAYRSESVESQQKTAEITIMVGAGSGTGRRKKAIARVRITPGSGKWSVNGHALAEYFPNKIHQQIINEPLVNVGLVDKFDITARINGGGASGQAGALRLGIARALNEMDTEGCRGSLKKAGLLTRDARVKERKKAGLKKARKAPQFSKR